MNAWSYTSTAPIRLHGVVLSETQGLQLLLLSSRKAIIKRKSSFKET